MGNGARRAQPPQQVPGMEMATNYGEIFFLIIRTI
jgi:hypothetical protein